MPKELEEEVLPNMYDYPIFDMFFEIYQRGKDFFQTIYYYQMVNEMELDGEDLSLLLKMWREAEAYYYKKDKKKYPKPPTKPKSSRGPRSKLLT